MGPRLLEELVAQLFQEGAMGDTFQLEVEVEVVESAEHLEAVHQAANLRPQHLQALVVVAL